MIVVVAMASQLVEEAKPSSLGCLGNRLSALRSGGERVEFVQNQLLASSTHHPSWRAVTGKIDGAGRMEARMYTTQRQLPALRPDYLGSVRVGGQQSVGDGRQSAVKSLDYRRSAVDSRRHR